MQQICWRASTYYRLKNKPILTSEPTPIVHFSLIAERYLITHNELVHFIFIITKPTEIVIDEV